MGARLCRRREVRQEPEAPHELPADELPPLVPDELPADELPRPRPVYYPTRAFHDAAVHRRRAKLGATWKECGQAKKSKESLSDQDRRPEPSWKRMVQHRLLTNRHHNHSQLLKEVKRNKKAEQ